MPEKSVLFHDSVLCAIVHVSQLRSDFIASKAGASPPLSAQEECLGLAVLDLWRMAKERHQDVKELCKTVRCHFSPNQTLLLIICSSDFLPPPDLSVK